jgi:hypothetical protein
MESLGDIRMLEMKVRMGSIIFFMDLNGAGSLYKEKGKNREGNYYDPVFHQKNICSI